MIVVIKRGGDVIFTREIKIEDGSAEGIQPAMLGWNQKLNDDILSLYSSPPGDMDEEIEINIQYTVACDTIVCYNSEITLEGKRKYVNWCFNGLNKPLHKEIQAFIRTHFS